MTYAHYSQGSAQTGGSPSSAGPGYGRPDPSGTALVAWTAHRGHGGAPGHTHPSGPTAPSGSPGTGGQGGPEADQESHRLDVHVGLLDENRRQAERIRRRLDEAGVFAVNLMSSPGAGKTSLLEATLPRLEHLRVGVIEGDIETTADADRLAPFDIAVHQINTGPFGGDCHLAAPLVEAALDSLPLDDLDLLFVENVGNLVCPAEFDIGEDRKVVLLSTTEGEDKPLKYPLMFRESRLALITKIDLAPHLDIDLDLIDANVERVHPGMQLLRLSARTGEGLDRWVEWLASAMGEKRS